MSRIGIEKKPPWRSVPAELRELVGKKIGSPVVRGVRVWGSYGPGPSHRLLHSDGRRSFIKALWPESNSFQIESFGKELRNYAELGEIMKPWAPELLGVVKHGDWHAMLLEDLGPKTAPPWRTRDARTVAHGLAEFHSAGEGARTPDYLRSVFELEVFDVANLWKEPVSSSDLRKLAGLAANPDDAFAWLERNVQRLIEASAELPTQAASQTVLHMDVRSDNLRVVDGRLRLFDWPFVCTGPHEVDAAAFAQTVEAEGGPDTATVLDWYQDIRPLDSDLLAGSMAAISGFFANRAWQPGIPDLPRIRPWQRAQLGVTLKLSAEMLGLDRPDWLESVR